MLVEESNQIIKKPQMNADKRRFVNSGIQQPSEIYLGAKLINSPQRTQRAQSAVTKIFATFAIFAVRGINYLIGLFDTTSAHLLVFICAHPRLIKLGAQ